MIRIRRDRLDLWLDALRSGEFEQAQGALRIGRYNGEDKFCCLGVGCEVAVRNGLDVLVYLNHFANEYTYDDAITSPSLTVWDWFGVDVDYTDSRRDIDELVDKCITMNDREGKTFAEIADWIENNVEAYNAF